jgi:sensor histidine kinase YesM
MMKLLDRYSTTGKLVLISLTSAIFIIYPNIACFSWDLRHMEPSHHQTYILFFIFRYLFFSILILILLIYNLRRFATPFFRKRLLSTFIICTIAYLIYVSISVLSGYIADCFTGILLFQYFVVCILSTFSGHIFLLTSEHRRKEQEIEHLKIENLQSRCDALTNQINPHFFFNSLNGLTSLIRKKNEENALEYVNKLSDVFRYVLQSDKKGLVKLDEELEFVQAFRYMMEVRFANKLIFNINIPCEQRFLRIPVLSLLPLIDNVVVHNIIDSEHKMEVNITLNDQLELSVSNPVFPKMSPPNTNGTGLKNLENRFSLLMDRQIRIVDDGVTFTVYLPLKKDDNENTDS